MKPPAKITQQYRTFLITLISIFVAEIVAMGFIYVVPISSYLAQTLIDASIMLVMIFPILYYYSLRPLTQEIQERERIEAALKNSHAQLEALVLERTKELANANLALQISRNELEYRVQKRTAELEKANQSLTQEIIERRRAEAQLNLHTKALESAANGIIITSIDGTILWANAAFASMSGYDTPEILGKKPGFLKSGHHDADFYANLWRTITKGNVWHGEIINRKKNGDEYIEEQTITPVWNDDGKVQHFISIKQDVTEQKKASQNLEKANHELVTMSLAEHQQRLVTESLMDAMIALNSSLDLTSVFDQIMEQVRRVIPSTASAIILIEETHAVIARQLGHKSYPKATSSLAETLTFIDFPFWNKVVSQRETVIVNDTASDQDWRAMRGAAWIRSALFAPLIIGDKVVGILNLNNDQPDAFKPDAAKLLKAFATPAAIAIQNARVYSAEQEARQIAETLSTASTTLSQVLEFDAVLSALLNYLEIAVGFDAALIILSDDESHYYVRTLRDTQACPLYIDQVNSLLEVKWEERVHEQVINHATINIPDMHLRPDWRAPTEFACVRAMLSLPLETNNKVMGVAIIMKTQPDSISDQDVRIAQAIVSQAAVAMQNAWLFDQIRAGREHLQMLSRRLVEVQENERREIARELHDETGQALTSLKLGLRLLEKDAENPQQVIEHVSRLRDTTDNVMESLHRLAMNLRPASLDHLGLVKTLNNFVESMRAQSGLKAKFRALGFTTDLDIPENIETTLYRITQEAMTNIIRHAKASRADVILEYRDRKLVLIIEDDGIGMGTKELSTTSRLGLIGMRERAEQLGGRMVLESTRGAGTTIVVEVPFEQ